MALNAGVLIIGSLLWDTDRQGWRDARLDVNRFEVVSAPIRYGRRSGKRRGYTYTMVFSRCAPAGHARVVWCSHTVASAEDLITEAVKLWEAESLEKDTDRIARGWGCVALLCNPERKIPANIANEWARRVEREPGYGKVSQTLEEGCLINKDGLLQMDWPLRVEEGAAVELDLLLVTANDPTLTGTPPSYPSVETITNAWNAAEQKHADYFWNNTDNGITTFQDDEIRARLRPRNQA
jgi:hypothetical protein